jgi:hypothetical protein
MKQEKDGKTLYHVQSITDYHDDPYDMFVWGKNEYEVEKQLKKLYKDDLGFGSDTDEIANLIANTNIYTVYAEEV